MKSTEIRRTNIMYFFYGKDTNRIARDLEEDEIKGGNGKVK